jgi:hypothetical protein
MDLGQINTKNAKQRSSDIERRRPGLFGLAADFGHLVLIMILIRRQRL